MTADLALFKRLSLSFLIISFIVSIDQVTKTLAIFANPNTVCNPAFAFGTFPGILNGVIAFLVLLGVTYLFLRERKFMVWLGLTAIIGGGTANILNRAIQGCVIDFIKIPFWPTFNLADVAIVFGVLVVLLTNIKQKLKAKDEVKFSA